MRLLTLLKSKIHRATVTDANLDYIGSITVDKSLLEKVGIVTNEQVHVWNITNGHRFVTYALPAPVGSGTICVNGAAAHFVNKGDKVIIAAFVTTDEPVIPSMILVDESNVFTMYLPNPD